MSEKEEELTANLYRCTPPDITIVYALLASLLAYGLNRIVKPSQFPSGVPLQCYRLQLRGQPRILTEFLN